MADIQLDSNDLLSEEVEVVQLVKKEQCNPWSEPLKCPLYIFIILAIIGMIINIYLIVRSPTVDAQGNQISASQKWVAAILSVLVMSLITVLFGVWIYSQCSRCRFGSAWLIALVALFLPLILFFITALLVSAFLGLSILTFGSPII